VTGRKIKYGDKSKAVKDGRRCPSCGHHFEGHPESPYRPTRDHIVPRSQGGKGHGNYQLLCAVCNEAKADRASVDWALRRHLLNKYELRRERWES